MNLIRLSIFLAGAAATAGLSLASTSLHGPELIADIEKAAAASRDEVGANSIEISFLTASGQLTRHATLKGGKGLTEDVRTQAAFAIANTPGVGGVTWRSRSEAAGGTPAAREQPVSLHCQDDVEAIVRVRSIRFAEASARIDEASQTVLNEVATALLPCVGSIIAINGHTDSNGDENANVALSRARAEAVRWGLIGRGIPADGLRATGVGSKVPLEGLAPEDPANRRIEFSVIETMPLMPTPIDTPGPGH